MKQKSHDHQSQNPPPSSGDESQEGMALRAAADQAAAADAEIERILSGDSEDFLRSSRQHGGE